MRGHSPCPWCVWVVAPQIVLPVVCILLWTLLQGMLAAWWGDYTDNAYYMCLAILNGQSPALMRLFVMPGITAARLAHHRYPEGVDRKELSVGEWLLCKETAYALQSVVLHLPVCWPTSPFARQAWAWWQHTVRGEPGVEHVKCGVALRRTNATGAGAATHIGLLAVVQLAVLVRYAWYVIVIGQHGGELCLLHLSADNGAIGG